MKKYVAGFFFDRDLEKVALITKARPDWQKGKLNGIGGHIEEGETPRSAMQREFHEETGIHTYEGDWTEIARLEKAEQFSVIFYKARGVYPYWHYGFKPIPDEPVSWYNVDPLPINVIYNLRYLIMIALDTHLEYPVLVKSR